MWVSLLLLETFVSSNIISLLCLDFLSETLTLSTTAFICKKSFSNFPILFILLNVTLYKLSLIISSEIVLEISSFNIVLFFEIALLLAAKLKAILSINIYVLVK